MLFWFETQKFLLVNLALTLILSGCRLEDQRLLGEFFMRTGENIGQSMQRQDAERAQRARDQAEEERIRRILNDCRVVNRGLGDRLECN